METNSNNHTIINAAASLLSKKYSAIKITKSVTLTAIGIALILAAVLSNLDGNSSTYMVLMTLGIIITLIYGLKLIIGSTELVYEPTKSPVKSYSLYFKPELLHNILDAVQTGNLSKLNGATQINTSGVRLDIVMSKDGKFAACQAYKYIPYNYEPASEVCYIKDEMVGYCSKLLNFNSK